jgi:uncharacterized protein (TIGR02996 family)
MRTFQFSDAKSHKFWTIDVKGKSFTVSYGKVGTTGQTQKKTFASPAAARAAADKLIAEKTKKGYAETTPKPLTAEAAAFAAALRENSHDRTGWSAFADYLMEQGDPRGEFMQTQLALEDESRPKKERDALKKKETALLKKHEREWLGPLAAVTVDAEPVTYWTGRGREAKRAPVAHEFSRGWLSRLVFHNLTVAQARALVTAPEARLVRALVIEGVEMENPVGKKESYIDSYYAPGPDVPKGTDSDEGPGLHALCRWPHLASVRVFQLGEGNPGLNGQKEESDNCHTPGDPAHHLVKQMPHLEELYLMARRVDANKLFALPLPNLRVLQLDHITKYPLDKLAANKTLTSLTALLCHPHAMEFDDEDGGAYIRLNHLRAICRSPHLTKLTHLRLRLTDFGDKGAEEIAASGILKRLKVLDLRAGCVSDAGAKTLADSPDLKNLEFLNLNMNALTKDGTKLLKATGVKVDTAEQHTNASGEFGDGEYPEYLFYGDME